MWPFTKPEQHHGCWIHHLLIFLAGASTMHTIGHIIIGYSHTLPIHFFGIEWTKSLNMWAIAINAIITIVLLWLASQKHDAH